LYNARRRSSNISGLFRNQGKPPFLSFLPSFLPHPIPCDELKQVNKHMSEPS